MNKLKNLLIMFHEINHIAYIGAQINDYETRPDAIGKEEDKMELTAKLKERNEKKEKYSQIKQVMENSREEQISTADPDSRSVILLRNIVNVGYNVQASSDAKHKLLVEYDTGSVNDTNALADLAIQTKELLKVDVLKVLADKGYHTGAELARCQENGITSYVSPKAPSTKDIGLYPMTDFRHDKDRDIYVCPQGQEMRTNNTWHRHSDNRKGKPEAYRFRRYNTPLCKNCESRQKCTHSKNGRYIDRSEYAGVTEANARRVNENPDYYKLRQQVTGHPFGTLKR